MGKFLTVWMILSFVFCAFGQENYKGKSVSRGKIFLQDLQVIEGQYIVFSDDSLEYYLKNSQERYLLGLKDVSKVMEFDGNYGNTGIWIGAFAGAGIGLVVALGTEETETTGYIQTTTIQTWPIYLFTAVGTLVGYLIGAGAEDWKTVYDQKTGFSLKNFDIQSKNSGVCSLSYHIYF